MKKSILILCAAFLLSANAYAADINVDLSFRHVHLDVTNTLGVEVPTLQVLTKDRTTLIYADEGVFEDGQYIFEDFSFPQNALTGEYIVRIGENGSISETTVQYSSFADITSAVSTITNNPADAVKALTDNALLFGTTSARVSGLSSQWQARLTNDISALTLKCDTDEDVIDSYNKINTAFQKILNYAGLTNQTNAQIIAESAQKISGLDLTLWDNLANKGALNSCFKAQSLDPLTIDDEGIATAFDGALLCAIINNSDWGTGREALTYYVNKGLLSIDSKYVNSTATVYKALKNKNITDYNDIPKTIEAIYKAQGSSGSGTSGGGGGGGGAPSSPKSPTNPIDTSQSTTKLTIDEYITYLLAPFQIENRTQIMEQIKNLIK